MSEDSIHRTSLVPHATSQLAQVLTAGRQLAIAARLKDDIDRDLLAALLKRIPYTDTINFLSSSQPLSADMIKRFDKWWDWDKLSRNENLPWSLELIKRFEERWDWSSLSLNESLPWPVELIERFQNRWDWGRISLNYSLPWSLELIERFQNRWDWGYLSGNKSLPWSLKLIERFEARWDWHRLSGNESLHLPTLRPADIVAIMEHHFGGKHISE